MGVASMNEAQATPIRDALRDVQEMWDELHRRGLNPQIMRRYSDAISVLERDFTGRLAAGVSALPTPKLCPGCAQYHGRNDCPVGWLAPAETYGVPASEYLAKIEADPRRAAALQRARDRAAGVLADAPAEQWPRDLSEAEMDELATALNEHDAGSIGFHGLVDRVLAVVRRTAGVKVTP